MGVPARIKAWRSQVSRYAAEQNFARVEAAANEARLRRKIRQRLAAVAKLGIYPGRILRFVSGRTLTVIRIDSEGYLRVGEMSRRVDPLKFKTQKNA